MRGFELDWCDFTDLLAAAPGTREEIRDLFQQGYGIPLPKTSYEVMWDRLSEQLGEESAGDAVCELVIETAPPRLFDLINELSVTGYAPIRLNEPRLIDLMFDSSEEISELGAYLVEYHHESRGSQHDREEAPPDSGLERNTPASRHIPERVKNAVWRRDGAAYVKCHSRERLGFDHIIPFSRGGASTYRNLELLCETCNRRKSASI